MTIEDWRAKIDALDRRLVELLSERAECVIAIGKIKNARSMEVFDPERERQIIHNVLQENKGPWTTTRCAGSSNASSMNAGGSRNK